MQVKLVENVLALINFTQLLLQVVCYVEHLARLALISDVPDLYAEVVARVYVSIVNRRKLGARYRINYVRKEVLARRVFLNHILRTALVELRVNSEIAQANVTLRA